MSDRAVSSSSNPAHELAISVNSSSKIDSLYRYIINQVSVLIGQVMNVLLTSLVTVPGYCGEHTATLYRAYIMCSWH